MKRSSEERCTHNTRKFIWNILTVTDVFLKQKRVNVCEHMVKMVSREGFWHLLKTLMWTQSLSYVHIHLLSSHWKELCDCQNIFNKFLCVCVCLSSGSLQFPVKASPFLSFPILCAIYISVLSFLRGLYEIEISLKHSLMGQILFEDSIN